MNHNLKLNIMNMSSTINTKKTSFDNRALNNDKTNNFSISENVKNIKREAPERYNKISEDVKEIRENIPKEKNENIQNNNTEAQNSTNSVNKNQESKTKKIDDKIDEKSKEVVDKLKELGIIEGDVDLSKFEDKELLEDILLALENILAAIENISPEEMKNTILDMNLEFGLSLNPESNSIKEDLNNIKTSIKDLVLLTDLKKFVEASNKVSEGREILFAEPVKKEANDNNKELSKDEKTTEIEFKEELESTIEGNSKTVVNPEANVKDDSSKDKIVASEVKLTNSSEVKTDKQNISADSTEKNAEKINANKTNLQNEFSNNSEENTSPKETKKEILEDSKIIDVKDIKTTIFKSVQNIKNSITTTPGIVGLANNVELQKITTEKASASDPLFSKAGTEKDVIKQVVNRFQLLKGVHGQQLRIQLKPAELGSIRLKIEIDNDVVMTKIQVESEKIKHVVEKNLQMLKDSLEEQGIKVDQFDVSSREKDQSGYKGELFEKGFNRRNGLLKNDISLQSESVEDEMSIGMETGLRYGYNSMEVLA